MLRYFLALVMSVTFAATCLGQSAKDVGVDIFQASVIKAESPILVESGDKVSIYSKDFEPKFNRGVLVKVLDGQNLLIRSQKVNEFPRLAEQLKEDLFFIEGKPGDEIYVEIIAFNPETGFRFYGEKFTIDNIPKCFEEDLPPTPDPEDPDLPPPPDEIPVVDTEFYNFIKRHVQAIPTTQRNVFPEVAKNFREVADKANKGEITTNQQFWQEVSRLNQATIGQSNLRYWDAFGVALQNELNRAVTIGKIDNTPKGRAPYILMVSKAITEVENE